MELRTTGKQFIKEVPWGVYLWYVPGSGYISDDAGHYMMIASTEGNQEKMAALRDAARSFGKTNGHPVFFSGNRIVTDEEYEEQVQRMKWGLTPDPLDISAINEEKRAKRNRG